MSWWYRTNNASRKEAGRVSLVAKSVRTEGLPIYSHRPTCSVESTRGHAAFAGVPASSGSPGAPDLVPASPHPPLGLAAYPLFRDNGDRRSRHSPAVVIHICMRITLCCCDGPIPPLTRTSMYCATYTLTLCHSDEPVLQWRSNFALHPRGPPLHRPGLVNLAHPNTRV